MKDFSFKDMRNENPAAIENANVTGANLSGMDLTAVNLSNTPLAYADLTNTRLTMEQVQSIDTDFVSITSSIIIDAVEVSEKDKSSFGVFWC